MQRHRRDKVGLLDQLPSGSPQPSGKEAAKLEPVGALERQNCIAAPVIVAHGGAGMIECRPVRKAAPAKGIRSWIEIKRQSAAGADGTIDESDLVPAEPAKAMWRAHRSTADEAQGWV